MPPERSAAGRGISLWLVPEDAVRESLALLIGELAFRLGTQGFAPHVTLLAGLRHAEDEALGCAGSLAASLETLFLPLGAPAGRKEHFRCLYLPVPETLKLLTARAQASLLFGVRDERSYEPHLSLVYGTLRDQEKQLLASELPPRLPPRARFTHLEVVRTQGPCEGWRPLRSFALQGT